MRTQFGLRNKGDCALIRLIKKINHRYRRKKREETGYGVWHKFKSSVEVGRGIGIVNTSKNYACPYWESINRKEKNPP